MKTILRTAASKPFRFAMFGFLLVFVVSCATTDFVTGARTRNMYALAEAEADRVGLMYLAKAGYDPRAAPRLWKRVHEKQGSGNALTALISTHPTNKDRWKDLEKHLPAAMEEFRAATGSYPTGYVPGQPISL